MTDQYSVPHKITLPPKIVSVLTLNVKKTDGFLIKPISTVPDLRELSHENVYYMLQINQNKHLSINKFFSTAKCEVGNSLSWSEHCKLRETIGGDIQIILHA